MTLAMIRYGIVLKHPGQPLLLLKQSHNAHNLLVNFNDEGLFLCPNGRLLVFSMVCFYPLLKNICSFNNTYLFYVMDTTYNLLPALLLGSPFLYVSFFA